MTNRILSLLCIGFIFASYSVKADVLPDPNIIRINNILAYEDVAGKIFKDAKNRHLNIFDARNQNIKIDDVTKDSDIVIYGSKLIDEIMGLYDDIMSDDDTHAIGYKTSKDDKIIVVVDKEKKTITSVMLNDQ